LGGLYVIGTNRHESLRIDRQLRGRAGRQGDPGSTRFFISLEDDLFERYGLTKMFLKRYRLGPQDAAVAAGPLQREIEHAQRIIEGQSFDVRRSLYKYTTLIELQRGLIQGRRDEILTGTTGDPGAGLFAEREPALFAEALRRYGAARLADWERRATLYCLDRCWSDHLAWVQDTREAIHLVSLGGKTPIDEFQRQATAEFLDLEGRIGEAVAAELAALVKKDEISPLDLERLKGPSSTWTYLVNEDQFGWGMEFLKGKNIGFAAIAGAVYGPLLTLVLLVQKLRKKKRTAAGISPPDGPG
jgi:preprotein translocase subunit SecA